MTQIQLGGIFFLPLEASGRTRGSREKVNSGGLSSFKAICRSPWKCSSIIENPRCSTSSKISSTHCSSLSPSSFPPSPGDFNYIHHPQPPLGSPQPSQANFSHFFPPFGIVSLPSHKSWSETQTFSSRCEISARIGIYFKTPAFKFFIKAFLPLPLHGKEVLICLARWERI